MRALITTNAATGHFLPMVPTARALVQAGHDVRIGCPAPFTPSVRSADLPVISCAEVAIAAPLKPPPHRPDHAGRLIWAVTLGWPRDARGWYVDLLRRAREWVPDVVVVEPTEHAGRVVAAALGLPVVEHGWGFPLPDGLTDQGARSLLDLYNAADVTPVRPLIRVDVGAAFTPATEAAAPRRFRYQPWSPRGQSLPAPDGRPRLLATLGTYADPGAAGRMQLIVQAARAHDVQVTVVLGASDRGTRSQFPADVTVLDWVDITQACAWSDVVAHHGGAGTSWATLLAGRGALAVPQAADQFRNAARLERYGAAKVVDPSGVNSSSLNDAVDELTGSNAFAARARDIAVLNERLPDVGQLATFIATECGRR